MTEKIEYILYANIFLTRGALRSTLIDFYTNEVYYITNDFYDILISNRILAKDKLIEEFGTSNEETINAYFNFLIEKNLITKYNKDIKYDKFNYFFKAPSEIDNCIIDLDVNVFGLDVFADILIQLSQLNTYHIQFRFFYEMSNEMFEKILGLISNYSFEHVDIIIMETRTLELSYLLDISSKFIQINNVLLFNPNKQNKNENFSTRFCDLQVVYGVDFSPKSCGAVHHTLFSPNFIHASESLKKNTCLNKKISIDIDGFIKNCPSQIKNYGNISNVKLQSVIGNSDFKYLWDIKKDDINVCKDCEFRHICTDCRMYIHDPNDIYSKPLKCGYNPYTCKWEDSD